MEAPIGTEQIYEDLLRRILSLELYPGKRISENEMANDYNVSRTLIRPAFAKLAQDRFLTIYPQRGTAINLIDEEYLKNCLLIRSSIEKEMVFRLCEMENRMETVALLKESIREQEKCNTESGYTEEYKHLDEEFHTILLAGAGNTTILELIAPYMLHIARWRNIYIDSGHKVSNLIEEHKAIVSCIEEGNRTKAQEAMGNHIHTTYELFENKKLYEKYAQYFEKQGEL